MAAVAYNPRTVEEIFKDFSARRNAVIRALTTGRLPLHLFISFLLFFLEQLFFFLLFFLFLAQMLTNFTPTAIPVSNHCFEEIMFVGL